jgi:hypothetical protein
MNTDYKIAPRLRVLVAVKTCQRPASRDEIARIACVRVRLVQKMVGHHINRRDHPESGKSVWSLTTEGWIKLITLGDEARLCEFCRSLFLVPVFERGHNKKRHCSSRCAREHRRIREKASTNVG